jgi:hypothetical protein
MRLAIVFIALSVLGCSEKKRSSPNDEITSDPVERVDSIRTLADDSKIKVFADYNQNSSYHDDLKKSFNYWNYDTAYYIQRIVAQNKDTRKRGLTVLDALKGTWIPIYALDSIFYVQKDCDHQLRFSINDSTFNFFDGMMVVEPYVMDKIKMKLTGFEITTRTPKKIVLTRLADQRTIYKAAFDDRCFYVTRLSDINRFPILVVECKKFVEPIERGVKLDEVKCK